MLALRRVMMMGELSVSRMLDNYKFASPAEAQAAESETRVNELGRAM